ncbi:MAG: gamma-glutamylcyclotransferase [Pseudomonadota bacterium]
MIENNNIWLFAYGSLLWRPGVAYDQAERGTLQGWERRFWQGSPDHRGTDTQPGRVVTLVPCDERSVTGRLYALPRTRIADTLAYLDHRESGGYTRCWVTVHREGAGRCRALTYVALPGNPHYLGDCPVDELAAHIRRSTGPSGHNYDYYQDLIDSLIALKVPPSELEAIRVFD